MHPGDILDLVYDPSTHAGRFSFILKSEKIEGTLTTNNFFPHFYFYKILHVKNNLKVGGHLHLHLITQLLLKFMSHIK